MTTMIEPWNAPLSEGLPSAEPVLFQQTVPRQLVHRSTSSEVFVTDLRVTSYNTFEVGSRWPGSHHYYGPASRTSHDPLLLVESLRQAGLLIAHVAFGVPAEFMFITHEKQFSIAPAGLRTNGTEPVDVLIKVTARDIRRRGRGFAGMVFEYRCFRDGVQIASAAIRWSCVSAAGYARLRGDRLYTEPSATSTPDLVRPELIGRSDEMNVLLTELPDRSGTWRLRLDPDHSVIFDHLIDHVPGMAAMEAARQAALLVVGQPRALPIGGDFSWQHYIELDRPCLVSAERDDDLDDGIAVVRVLLEQDGHIAVEGQLELRLDG